MVLLPAVAVWHEINSPGTSYDELLSHISRDKPQSIAGLIDVGPITVSPTGVIDSTF